MIKMDYTKVTLCLGTVLLLLICGCTQEEPSKASQTSSSKKALCSTDEYQTYYSTAPSSITGGPTIAIQNNWRDIKQNFQEDEGKTLNDIAELTCLEYLSLRTLQVSDISPLKPLKNLKVIDLGETKISDIEVLGGMEDLISVGLKKTEVSDLSDLSNLIKLRTLFADDTPVSEISPLNKLKNLEKLGLENTQVFDVSVLKGLPKLTYVNLIGSKVSPEDCEALKQALPQATVKC